MKQESLVQVGVKALIFNKEGKILVLKRNPEKYPGLNGLWDIPGGRIDSKFTLEENLKREIFEETKLKPKIISIVSGQDIIKPEIRVLRLIYISHETTLGTKVSLSDEHTEYKWVKPAFLLKINNQESYIRAIVKDKNKMSFILDTIKNTLDRKQNR